MASLLLGPLPALAAVPCTWAAPTVRLTSEIAEPRLDNTLTQPQLQRLKPDSPHRGRTLGLYTGELSVGWRSRFRWEHDARQGCLRLLDLEITAAMPERTIYLIRERRPGTCDYDAVLGHERKHQAADDAVLAEHLPRLRAALAEAAGAMAVQLVAASDEQAARSRLDAALKAAFDRAFEALSRDRKARQRAIDTPAEYRRVGAACDPLRDRK